MLRGTRQRRLAWASLCLALSVLAGVPARAQDLGDAEDDSGSVSLMEAELDATIQAATKTQIPVSKAPGAVSVITDREIRVSGARTIGELLRVVAGVDVRWNVMVQAFTIRGFGENPFTSRVLLLIDGVPYNAWDKGGFPEHPGLDFFVMENIKRLEIIRSPGSALYGEDAYWGVINIVSISGTDLRGGEAAILGGPRETLSASARWGNRIGEKGSVLFTGKYLDSMMPRGFWTEEKLKNRSGDFFIKGGWSGLQLSWFRHQSEQQGFSEAVPLGPPPAPQDLVFKSAEKIQQTVNILAAKLEQPLKNGDYSIGADLAYENRFGHHCAACHAERQSPLFDAQADHGYQLLGELRVGIHKLPHNDLLIGTEFRRRAAGEHVQELAAHPPDHLVSEYNKMAYYVQDQITLAEEKLRIVAGARYDAKTKLFDSAVSPRISVVYNPTAPLVLRAGWGRARRLPNFFELYQESWHFNGASDTLVIPFSVFTPNPKLRPEKIETFELGGEYRFQKKWLAKIDLFRSKVKDFIVLDSYFLPPPTTLLLLQNVNHPDAGILYGGELELRGQLLDRLNAFVNYAYQHTEAEKGLTTQVGNPLEVINAPKHKINLGAYVEPIHGWSGSFDLQWRSSFLGPRIWYETAKLFGALDPTTKTPFEIGKYTYVNVRLSYDLPWNVGSLEKPLRLSLYGRNLLDQQPIETLDNPSFGEESQVAGRELFGELRMEF